MSKNYDALARVFNQRQREALQNKYGDAELERLTHLSLAHHMTHANRVRELARLLLIERRERHLQDEP